ncbi:sugar diacid recognition domain-containing protein [Bacillus sp. OK048]|uniref:CdaR family transcriptional regulator n=1 Tax=Bacillus sp. OK048 TaxID=1882761 RepID=UPI00088B82DE|nr:sugar diacid recognition domain-containing protein [Bacillus sp. OK048]SDM89048.1 transcriptional regulator, CdaR family [Bacillus sp. OK048]
MLQPELAEKIVREVQRLISEEIIVVSTDGMIISSTNRERVGTFHQGALITSQQKKKLIITEKESHQLEGVKSGINLPIFFQNDVIGVIGITGDPKTVTPFGEIIRKMTELLISENYYGEQFDYHSRAMETFVLEWLQAKEPSPDLLERARALSINLELNRTAVMIQFKQSPLTRDAWSSILNSFSQNKNDVLTRYGNERIIVLIDGSNSIQPSAIKNRLKHFLDFIKNSFGIAAYAGVGHCTPPSNLHESYIQAKRALNMARGDRSIIFDEELTLEMITGELTTATKSEYIKRTIGPILKEADLLETLAELFNQNHSLKNTAKSLHIHINTLHYRLKKIEELTHLNSSRTHDLLCLYLAVLFLDEYPKNK